VTAVNRAAALGQWGMAARDCSDDRQGRSTVMIENQRQSVAQKCCRELPKN